MMSRAERIEKNKNLWTGVEWDEVAAFIGPNAEAFKPAWQAHRDAWVEKGRPPAFLLSWCWPALIPILGIPWFAARKQWPMVATLIGAVVFFNIVLFFMPSAKFGFMLFLVAVIAKPTYVQSAVAKIAKIKETVPAGPQRQAAIAEAGGLNMRNGYIAGAASAAFLLPSVLALIASS